MTGFVMEGFVVGVLVGVVLGRAMVGGGSSSNPGPRYRRGGSKPKKPDSLPEVSGTPRPPTSGTTGQSDD